VVALSVENLPLWSLAREHLTKEYPDSCKYPHKLEWGLNCEYGKWIDNLCATVSEILLLSLLNSLDSDGARVCFGWGSRGSRVSPGVTFQPDCGESRIVAFSAQIMKKHRSGLSWDGLLRCWVMTKVGTPG